MSSSESPWSGELTIPSVVDEGLAIIATILAQLETLGWEPLDQFAVHLAMEEAVVNGIRHGNKLDPAKSLRINYRADADEFHVEVTDEGPGFDPHAVPDPTVDENLEKTSGRGIMMMEIYMSHVQFNEKGNSVRMSRRRGAPINVPDDDDESMFAD